GCVAIGVDDALKPCHFGATSSSIKVVLYGDSHAAQWFPGLQQVAKNLGVDLIVLAKGGCPTAAVAIGTATLARTCPAWRDKAIAYIASVRPALVIITSSSHYSNSDSEWATGFDETLSRIIPSAGQVLVLGDNPGATRDPAECLSLNLRSTDACATKRSRAAIEQRVLSERPVARKYGAIYVDTTDWFCTAQACPMIIGDLMIFRDINHITTFAAEYFEPFLEATLTPILREGRPPS
ncbi:MAG TPA: SGNH hydrolase domain-containing protein, partial [Acidimicrobiales bacterium]|nr:SGNH hydrolase domain-containing protein [Acidimicrobiales bacterium]